MRAWSCDVAHSDWGYFRQSGQEGLSLRRCHAASAPRPGSHTQAGILLSDPKPGAASHLQSVPGPPFSSSWAFLT